MVERKRLSDILLNTDRDRLEKAWTATKAADELKPIPTGEYRCRIVAGELFTSKRGTPGFKVRFEILEGDYAGRVLFLDIWLSEAALPMAKRDLVKLGIESVQQLERPLPAGIVVTAKVAFRRGDNGEEFNRVTRFEVVAIEPPGADPYAPSEDDFPSAGFDSCDAGGFDWEQGEQREAAPR